jgi:anti-sigma factor RsiW
MDCGRVTKLISAYADGELEPLDRAGVEEHLRTCSKCASTLKSISMMKAAMGQESLHHRAPMAFHDRILQLVDEAASEPVAKKTSEPRTAWRWGWIAGAIAALLLIGIGLTVYLMTPSEQKRLATEAVWNHKRSLLANHLVDVASSDPKKVSAWLDAKLEFRPWVPEEAPAGYLLVGARVDILDGRDVAALVYRNNDQLINIFEWPALPKVAIVDLKYAQIQGLNVGYWSNPAWNFYTVSNGDALSIQPLTEMFVAQSCSGK